MNLQNIVYGTLIGDKQIAAVLNELFESWRADRK